MPLSHLPTELLLDILAFLPASDGQCLRNTCREFRAALPLPAVHKPHTPEERLACRVRQKLGHPGCCDHVQGRNRWLDSAEQENYVTRLNRQEHFKLAQEGQKGWGTWLFMCNRCWRIKPVFLASESVKIRKDRAGVCKRCLGEDMTARTGTMGGSRVEPTPMDPVWREGVYTEKAGASVVKDEPGEEDEGAGRRLVERRLAGSTRLAALSSTIIRHGRKLRT